MAEFPEELQEMVEFEHQINALAQDRLFLANVKKSIETQQSLMNERVTQTFKQFLCNVQSLVDQGQKKTLSSNETLANELFFKIEQLKTEPSSGLFVNYRQHQILNQDVINLTNSLVKDPIKNTVFDMISLQN